MGRVVVGRWVGERAAGAEEDAEPEAALVARVAVDPRAFGALYDRYAGPVYRYCLGRLGSREAAEDATSQVFLSALVALPRYRERGTFRAWLFAIAHNVVTDAQRRQGRLVPGEIPDRPDRSPTPEDSAIAAEEGRRLWELLTQLPPDQRRAVELRLAGLSGVEIAAVLGRSHRAVKMLQFRAVAKLRLLLGAEPGPKETDDARP